MKLIPLTQDKFAQVDDEDFEFLNQFKWFAKKDKHSNIYYALRNGYSNNKRIIIRMHRDILKLFMGDKRMIDHMDRDGLNNQKSNLRLCTAAQNAANRKPKGKSKYLGVSFCSTSNRWKAQLHFNGKRVLNKYFNTEIDAAKSYDESAKIYHKEFANLNFKNNHQEVINNT